MWVKLKKVQQSKEVIPTKKADVTAVIMASGHSSRMQQNKLFLPFQEATFLERTIQLVQSVGFGKVVLVIKPEDLGHLKIPKQVVVIENNASDRGQSASVRLGTAQVEGQGVIFLTADQPLLTRDILMMLIKKGEVDKIVFPTREEQPATPIFFGSHYFDELLRVTGDRGGRQVRDRFPNNWLTFPVVSRLLMDVDTPEDYQNLLEESSVT